MKKDCAQINSCLFCSHARVSKTNVDEMFHEEGTYIHCNLLDKKFKYDGRNPILDDCPLEDWI